MQLHLQENTVTGILSFTLQKVWLALNMGSLQNPNSGLWTGLCTGLWTALIKTANTTYWRYKVLFISFNNYVISLNHGHG